MIPSGFLSHPFGYFTPVFYIYLFFPDSSVLPFSLHPTPPFFLLYISLFISNFGN